MAARHADSRLRKPLTIIGTADEESTFSGARHLAARGTPKAAAAVIGEPTGMAPIRAYRGFTSAAIAIQGSSGHSSNPALGDNALEALSGTRARTVAFGTEAPFFQALGMETVVFGAGSIDQAHQPDEYLDTAQIKPMEDALTTLIHRYCC